jgi:hypothetical protein
MILELKPSGWVNYPNEIDIKSIVPQMRGWGERAGFLMLRTLSKDLLSVRVSIKKLKDDGDDRGTDAKRNLAFSTEYKERGVGEWSKWSRIKFSVPKRASGERLDLSKLPTVMSAREALIEDVEHLLAFYGAVGTH